MTTCSICLEQISKEKTTLKCNHIFCKGCLKEYIEYTIKCENKNKIECPNCREQIIDTDNNEINELINNLSEKELIIYNSPLNTYFDLLVNMNNLIENIYNNIDDRINDRIESQLSLNRREYYNTYHDSYRNSYHNAYRNSYHNSYRNSYHNTYRNIYSIVINIEEYNIDFRRNGANIKCNKKKKNNRKDNNQYYKNVKFPKLKFNKKDFNKIKIKNNKNYKCIR